jgi:hypothetical protein
MHLLRIDTGEPKPGLHAQKCPYQLKKNQAPPQSAVLKTTVAMAAVKPPA